jgi:hypothetical protein
MQDSRTIELREDESGNLVETLQDLKERTYYPHQEYVWATCENIQVQKALKDRARGSKEPPQFVTTLTGRATLTQSDLGLIGEPSVSTKILSLHIRIDDRPFTPAAASEELEHLSHFEPSGRVTLGFNRADWESFSNDDWSLTCGVSTALFDEILVRVLDGTLRSMTIAVLPRRLWSEGPQISLSGNRTRLLLRPRIGDNSLAAPEFALCELMVLTLRLGKGEADNARLATTNDPFTDKPEVIKPPVMVPDHPPDAMFHMGERIDALRNTVKWVGAAIAVLLAIVAVRF